MKLKFSKYLKVSDSLDVKNDIKSEKIVFSTRTAKGIKITNYVIELIRAGEFTMIPDRLFTILMYHEIIVPFDEDELDLVLKRKHIGAQDALGGEASVFICQHSTTVKVLKEQLSNKLLELVPKDVQSKANNPFFLNLSIQIENLENGFNNFNLLREIAQSTNLPSTVEVNYEILITNKNLNNLLDYLPIRNPNFNRITFCFHDFDVQEYRDEALDNYLSALLASIKYADCLKELPVKCVFIFQSQSSEILQTTILKLKELSEKKNCTIVFHFQKGKTEKENGLIQEAELKILRLLSQNSIKVNFIPSIDNKFWPSYTPFANLSKTTDYVINIFDDYNTNNYRVAEDYECFAEDNKFEGFKSLYNEGIKNQVAEAKIKCFNCEYLPMCGGRLNKSSVNDLDCPAFITNFMKKVEFMYNFSLENKTQ